METAIAVATRVAEHRLLIFTSHLGKRASRGRTGMRTAWEAQ
jgi:hypothetical protein